MEVVRRKPLEAVTGSVGGFERSCRKRLQKQLRAVGQEIVGDAYAWHWARAVVLLMWDHYL